MEHAYCVIMAGGKGERFWPLSTRRAPKSFVKLVGEKSMIRMTIDRARAFLPADRIMIALEASHMEEARRQLPDLRDDRFIVEPVGRDTSPCIAFAALLLRRKDPEAVMVALPVDHYIPDAGAFARVMARAVEWSRRGDFLVTIGVRPTRPEKGYGYIHAGPRISPDASCFRVDRFVEKPDEETAARCLAEGGYFWNSGIFVWRADVLLEGIERHVPEVHRGLEEIENAIEAGDEREVGRIFSGFREDSIDYSLMEKADNVVMIPADFAWDDVGTWGSLRRVMELDGHGNYTRGKTVCVDTKDCVVYGDDTVVGTIGVSNLIIVASRHGVLVCDPAKDQEIRKIARLLEEEGGVKGR